MPRSGSKHQARRLITESRFMYGRPRTDAHRQCRAVGPEAANLILLLRGIGRRSGIRCSSYSLQYIHNHPIIWLSGRMIAALAVAHNTGLRRSRVQILVFSFCH